MTTDPKSIAEREAIVEHHADRILRASGSALHYYTMPSTRKAIMDAVREAMSEHLEESKRQ